jgi:hypothetical protein
VLAGVMCALILFALFGIHIRIHDIVVVVGSD